MELANPANRSTKQRQIERERVFIDNRSSAEDILLNSLCEPSNVMFSMTIHGNSICVNLSFCRMIHFSLRPILRTIISEALGAQPSPPVHIDIKTMNSKKLISNILLHCHICGGTGDCLLSDPNFGCFAPLISKFLT